MRRSILIVDDDTHIQDLLKLFLEQAGFDIRICNDGYSALDEVSNKPFDLVILDIAMPHMNGLKVLQNMKANEALKNIPVLMLSGSADKSDVHKASFLGVTDYIIKPPKKKDLLQRVERVLGGSPQFQQLRFEEGNPNVSGFLESGVELHSLSRKGMVLKSCFELPVGHKINNLNIPLLVEIGIQNTSFKVSECHEENKGEFHYHISFIDLNQKDREKFNEWIISESFKRKSQGKKVS